MASTAITAPVLLTKSETAEYLSISTRTLDRIVSTGVIKPVRVTKGALRYRRDDIDAFAASLPHDRGVSPSTR